MPEGIYFEDRVLLDRALRDPNEFPVLFRHLTPAITGRCQVALRRRPDDAVSIEDLVQHTWANLLAREARQLTRYDPSRGVRLSGFVGIIAARIARDHLKRPRPVVVTSVEDVDEAAMAAPSGDDAAIARVDLERLRAAVSPRLSTRAKHVFDMRFFGALAPTVIARTLGEPVHCIHNDIHRIRVLVRSYTGSAPRGPHGGSK